MNSFLRSCIDALRRGRARVYGVMRGLVVFARNPLAFARDPRLFLRNVAYGQRYFSRLFGARLLGRFVIINVLGLIGLSVGFLVLSQSRQVLTNTYEDSLHAQARIIAGAISQAVSNREFEFFEPSLLDKFPDASISDEWQVREATRIMQRIGVATPSRVRLYGRNGNLILDSTYLGRESDVVARALSPLPEDRGFRDYVTQFWYSIMSGLRRSYPILNEMNAANGLQLPEVSSALRGTAAVLRRESVAGEDILTVAVPVRGYRNVIGALMLSTPPGQIDRIVIAERLTLLELTFLALLVSVAMSLTMAATIILPIRRLARAMRQLGRAAPVGIDAIPDYATRGDEIAELSTTLRDMTRNLLHRINMIDSFAADVAHELKNPLTSLHSAVQTLAQTENPATRAQLSHIIEHDVRRLNRLITDISRASRLDAELGVGDDEVFDLSALARNMGAALQFSYAEEAQVTLLVSADMPCFVRAHEQRVAQIIDNLLSNAVSFSPAQGKIYLTTRIKPAEIDMPASTDMPVPADERAYGELIVTDEGPGLPDGTQERVFDRFYSDRRPQRHAAPAENPARKNDGEAKERGVQKIHSGLGLSISRQIARAYNGDVVAANRPDGQGTYFTITLPLVSDEG